MSIACCKNFTCEHLEVFWGPSQISVQAFVFYPNERFVKNALMIVREESLAGFLNDCGFRSIYQT